MDRPFFERHDQGAPRAQIHLRVRFDRLVGGAAQRLGLKPTTLYGKMRKHGLKRDADWV
jgi:transcriptional regulator with GAF, ATPase, and Fis domain